MKATSIQQKKKQLVVNRGIFWDISEERIPLAIIENPSFCIPRIFEQGNMVEIKDMIDYYGYEMVKATLKEQLSKRIMSLINLACVMFDLEKKDFECYKNKQFRHIY